MWRTRSTLAIRQELEVVGNDLEFAALLAGGLVIPDIHLEASFDEHPAALGEIFLCVFGTRPPYGHVHKGRFIFPTAVAILNLAIHRNPEVRNRGAFRRVPEFGITC